MSVSVSVGLGVGVGVRLAEPGLLQRGPRCARETKQRVAHLVRARVRVGGKGEGEGEG